MSENKANTLENKIIIRSVFKVTRCYMEPAKNPSTNRYADSVRKTNSQGDMLLSEDDRNSGKYLISEEDVIEIFDGKSFNLDDQVDAAWWDAIKYSKKIALDRTERDKAGNLVIDGSQKRYGTAEFYVERPGLETKVKNNKRREIHDAREYIYNDTDDGRSQKVRLLGNSMPNSPASDIEDHLISLAERNPSLITELYTGTDTHLRIFLLDAQDKKVIYNKDKLYFYGQDIILGATDTAVIAWFKNPDNKRILDLIKSETYPDFVISNIRTVDQVTEADLQPKPKVVTKE